MRAKNVLRRDMPGRIQPGIWAVTVVGFLNSAGFSLSLPFMALYLFEERGLSMTAVGAAIFATGVLSAFAQMASGELCDRFGRRPLLLGSASALVLLQLTLAGLVAVSAPVWYILLAYSGVRVSLMAGRPAFSAMVADLSSRSRLTESYGLLRIGQNAGWAAGPAAGGYLLASASYAWSFVLAGAIGIVTFALAAVKLRESLAGKGSAPADEQLPAPGGVGKDFLQFMALGTLIYLVMSQLVSTLSLFTVGTAGFSAGQFGLLLTLNGVIIVLFQYPVTRALGRVRASAPLVAGSALYGLGYLTFAWVGGFPLAAAAMTVVTLGEIMLAPTMMAVAGRLAPQKSRGRYMGLLGLSETLGMALGPMVGGVLLDSFPGRPLFVWGAVALLAMAAALGFLLWSRRQAA